MQQNGKKFDSEKPDMSLLSSFALEQIAQVMTHGKKKYGANNWRAGIAYSRLFAAVQRHLSAYNRGEKLDLESGLNHLAHASCGLMMLLEFEVAAPTLNDLYHHTKANFNSLVGQQLVDMDQKVATNVAPQTSQLTFDDYAAMKERADSVAAEAGLRPEAYFGLKY